MNHEKKIQIHIKSKQTEIGNLNKAEKPMEENTIEFYAEGSYHEIGESRYITYKESEVSGMEGTTTTLKITGSSEDEHCEVSLIRFGSIHSKLVFKKGTETKSLYKTPYGTFELLVNTQVIKLDFNHQKASSLYVQYILDINGQSSHVHELLVSFN